MPITIRNEFSRILPFYDGGLPSDPLWVLRDSMGIVGIVRASTWEEAYECAEDELFPEADQTWEEMARECGCSPDELIDNACFQEAYGFRPNGPSVTDKLGHGVYARDLNGESLDRLTEKLAKDLRLAIERTEEEG